MNHSTSFLSMVLDSMTESIVVIDEQGRIEYTNNSWLAFGKDNGCALRQDWRSVNYLHECDKAAEQGDMFGLSAGDGIRRVIEGRVATFNFEYPCDSPDERRWFLMSVTPCISDNVRYIVISHRNITERKLAEERVHKLAQSDSLTGIANRRVLYEFLDNEINRSIRLKHNLCVALIDLDHFKLINDTYGHDVGDSCLIKVTEILSCYSQRSVDQCARLGGDEFVIIWGETSLAVARRLSQTIIDEVSALRIPNKGAPVNQYLTVSVGLTSLIPARGVSGVDVLKMADDRLYEAKEGGRNRLMCL
ncbi:diguanylate cyclase [Amphritea sp. 1_MG-2023]|uniref:sensor domain-containing diguanylate cyclase n=1 Tax=Amphritea sp. 1_MG-2023 TaxID=3062670 RepID=UPI0026E1B633|nr:diguanylate cyclase [Amphritea sp. 1_MG-2023]MDO6561783.1 diguanylate cyclase [Amphritea sp. 1_MG-2023]